MNGPDPSDDATLARLAQGGSCAAFGVLVSRHHERIFAFLLTLARQRQDAEDLTQETFLRAWDKIHLYDPGQPLLPWLFTMGRRLSIAALRRKRKIPDEALEPVELHSRDTALWLWEGARDLLSADAYSALWLHYREELSLREIGKILGKREGTIKVMLHRARKVLAMKLRPGTMTAQPCNPAARTHEA